MQCALVAKRYSPYLVRYYDRIKSRRGGGKAIIALAREFLGIIYRTLKTAGYSRIFQTSCWGRLEVERPEFFMPRQPRAVRYSGRGPAPRQGDTPWTPGPRSLLPQVPERSSPSRVRSAAHTPRALDGSGPFRRFIEIRESGQLQSPLPAAACFLLVGPGLFNTFGVDKTS